MPYDEVWYSAKRLTASDRTLCLSPHIPRMRWVGRRGSARVGSLVPRECVFAGVLLVQDHWERYAIPRRGGAGCASSLATRSNTLGIPGDDVHSKDSGSFSVYRRVCSSSFGTP